ncbi:hypothetical protein BC940DRAFT_24023 [Gongronella butleri]|nr:hypothetical protein BC940DRAFT_24023 [Gongronella butleri]
MMPEFPGQFFYYCRYGLMVVGQTNVRLLMWKGEFFSCGGVNRFYKRKKKRMSAQASRHATCLHSIEWWPSLDWRKDWGGSWARKGTRTRQSRVFFFFF